jgi:hypothetical protein
MSPWLTAFIVAVVAMVLIGLPGSKPAGNFPDPRDAHKRKEAETI